ncbi:hypothetical protein [Fibrobacter sp. UWEL]|uniref:hypothetical protein n=1 Tax=Fibrobacter sp. UWEL TaxID=1896209 RepID=UPI0009188D43|nr:hypothetical protein [Fibrobacter sp. UWEL]SHK55165.1 hypothetical protein SAMN05720468_10389 [Fibrobacter sp. UWEL]
MKKIAIVLVAFLCSFAMAQMDPSKKLIILPMIVSATDLTNLSQAQYNVHFNLADKNLVQGINELAGKNLCERDRFAAAVGSAVCSHEVKFTESSSDKANIIITDAEVKAEGKVLVVCTQKFNGCDLTIGKEKGFDMDTESMKSKGFVPDPTLKQRRPGKK